jgi:hypothetical protein
MIFIRFYRTTGEVDMRTTVPDLSTASRLSSDLGLPFIVVSGTQADGYVKDGTLVPFPAKPSPSAVWSWDTHEWIEP